MQLRIINILLEDVYVTKDYCLERLKFFTKKGRALRAHGIDDLEDCIQCFSEAISTFDEMYGDIGSCGYLVCHQLAVAYCLRALCTQEADPTSKQVFQDIHAALDIWLRINIPDHSTADEQCKFVFEMTILLLFRVIDLLSLKGHRISHDIYKLMFRLFKWKNVPLEKCLAMLWKYRRLSHALCASPVNESFIVNFLEHCGEQSKCIDYWISCLRGSQRLVLGFQQNFSFLFTILTQDSYDHRSSFQLHITIDEVKAVASDLISSVPTPSHSIFLAGYLYHVLCERLMSNGRLIEVNQIQDSLAMMGDNSTAFSLPQPHLQRTKLCDMKDGELDPIYVKKREQLKELFATNIRPKIVQGKTLNRREFVSFLEQVLYVGDHIYGDILCSKKVLGWRIMLVLELLCELREMRKLLQSLRSGRDQIEDKIHHIKWSLNYLSIVKDEGLEISQPGLEPAKSELHHQITIRGKKSTRERP